MFSNGFLRAATTRGPYHALHAMQAMCARTAGSLIVAFHTSRIIISEAAEIAFQASGLIESRNKHLGQQGFEQGSFLMDTLQLHSNRVAIGCQVVCTQQFVNRYSRLIRKHLLGSTQGRGYLN